MFPGVVSGRHRRSSVQRPGSSALSETEGAVAWARRSEADGVSGGPEAVIEEPDDADE
jgi:hypothetical protein